MISSPMPPPKRTYARAGIDFAAIASALVLLLQFIFSTDFNPGNDPEPTREDEFTAPVQVDPNTGTRSPRPVPGPPI
jgi:hypothetical protein